jgi:hypothetical protein
VQIHVGTLLRTRHSTDKVPQLAETSVPTLFRFLLVVGLLAALVYGGMVALVTYVEPQQHEIIQTLSPAKLNKDK